MTRDDLHALALQAARSGAAAIRSVTREPLDVQAKAGIEDYVTSADHAAERAIIDVILAARPDDEILAEETEPRRGTSGVRWYIDPIDGTANFIAGSPDYAISIAAHGDGTPTAAIIYRPADDVWLGTSKTGLTGTLTPDVAPPRPLKAANITISRPHEPSLRATAMSLRKRLITEVADERRIGSAACALLSVVTGSIDAYLSVNLPPWDTAAGHHLVRLCGGAVHTIMWSDQVPIMVAGSRSTVASIRDALDRTGVPRRGP